MYVQPFSSAKDDAGCALKYRSGLWLHKQSYEGDQIHTNLYEILQTDSYRTGLQE